MAPPPFLSQQETEAFLETFDPLSHLVPPQNLGKRLHRERAKKILLGLEIALNEERRITREKIDAALAKLEEAKQHYFKTVAEAEKRLEESHMAARRQFDMNYTEEENIYSSAAFLDNELAQKVRQVVEVRESF